MNGVLWRSSEIILTVNAQATILYYQFENYTLKISPYIQVDNELKHSQL